MTNTEIIINEAIANQIYTKEQIEIMLSNGVAVPLHTFAHWKSIGYSVRKGEHARVATRLWKYKNSKVAKEDGTEEEQGNMYLAKAFLFTLDQVEKVVEA